MSNNVLGSSSMSLEISGLNELEALFLRLKDFKAIAKPAVGAAADAAKPFIQAALPPGKARDSVGARVRSTGTGVVGVVGPRGGRFRAGYLAALFLEKGTGLGGPRHRRLTGAHGGSLSWPSDQAITSRFGAHANAFTKSGRLTQRASAKFGNAAFTTRASTAGMRAQPWLARARSRAIPAGQAAAKAALRKAIDGRH